MATGTTSLSVSTGAFLNSARVDGDGAIGRDQQRVAVRLALGHLFKRDVAAGAGAVFDHDR